MVAWRHYKAVCRRKTDSGDATRIAGMTYFGRADKARRELDWQPQPVEERLRETVEEMK